MAAGTTPIFTQTPNTGGTTWPSALAAANNIYDGTGTVQTIFTAGANGAFINKIKFKAMGTNIATVARIFLNNGSTNATAANNVLVDEITLPATTASATAATLLQELLLNMPMQTGHKINVVLGTAVAAGYAISAHGGDY